MAKDNVLHYQQLVQCEEQECDRTGSGFVANQNDLQQTNLSKTNLQTKIVDHCRPMLNACELVSQPSDRNANLIGEKVDSLTQAFIDDVCSDLDAIVAKPHKTVECLRQLNHDVSDTCSNNSFNSNICQPVVSTSSHSDGALIVHTDLHTLQSSAVNETSDALLTGSLENASGLLLNTNTMCTLPTQSVQNRYSNNEESGSFENHLTDVVMCASNNAILSSSTFSVIDSATAVESGVDMQQMQCISIEVVTDESRTPGEQLSISYVHEAPSVEQNVTEPTSAVINEPMKKSNLKEGYKLGEHRNARARRISAKMKMLWAKELEATGHLMCPMQGCYQTYVTVANFMTHYKWCTGKKNLQHCPYCDSLIFAGEEAVLHHMQVEHPENVHEYKEKLMSEEVNTDVQLADDANSMKPFMKKTNKRFRIKSLTRKFSSKENILSQKKPTLRHGIKSIERTMSQNFKEFKKCVRFNDIVQKINSVRDEPISASNINSKKINITKPFRHKKSLFIDDSSDNDTDIFSTESDSVDCPSHDGTDNKIQLPKKVTTKSRIVLNTQGYERFNQYLKLTRDWASERKTYSRSRSTDNSFNMSHGETSFPLDVQDTYQLSESLENTGVLLSVTESELDTNEIMSPHLIKSLKKEKKETSQREKSYVKSKKLVNEIPSEEVPPSEKESALQNLKPDAFDASKNNKFPPAQNTLKPDSHELNYGHILFSKPNKVANRERTTCYDNAGSLSIVAKKPNPLGERNSEKTSVTQDANNCPPPVIDFDTLLQSSIQFSKEKQKSTASSASVSNTSDPVVQDSTHTVAPEDKTNKGSKGIKYRKQDGVKLPNVAATETKTQKKIFYSQNLDIINPSKYNEALNACYNEAIEFCVDDAVAAKYTELSEQISAAPLPSASVKFNPPLLKNIAFGTVIHFTTGCNMVNTSVSVSPHRNSSSVNADECSASESCISLVQNHDIVKTCLLTLMHVVDKVSHKLEKKPPVLEVHADRSLGYAFRKKVNSIPLTLHDYLFNFEHEIESDFILSFISSRFKSYPVLPGSFSTEQKKKRGRPSKKFLDLKYLFSETVPVNSNISSVQENSLPRVVKKRGRKPVGIASSNSDTGCDLECHSISNNVSSDIEAINSSLLHENEMKKRGPKKRNFMEEMDEYVSDASLQAAVKSDLPAHPNNLCPDGSDSREKEECATGTNSSACSSTALSVVKRKRGRPPKKKISLPSDLDLLGNCTFHKILASHTSDLHEDAAHARAQELNTHISSTESNNQNNSSTVGEKATNKTSNKSSVEKNCASCGLRNALVPKEIEIQSDLQSIEKGKAEFASQKHSPSVESVGQKSAAVLLREGSYPIRKSTRLRKRKVDPDAVFMHPRKSSQILNCSFAHFPDSVKKPGKRGRPRKQLQQISDSPNCLQPFESNTVCQPSDSHNVSFSVPTSAKSSKTNLDLCSGTVHSRKCSRKGRPRKCVRYADLNSGIDSPESLSEENSGKESVEGNSNNVVDADVVNGSNQSSSELPVCNADLPSEIVTEDADLVTVDDLTSADAKCKEDSDVVEMNESMNTEINHDEQSCCIEMDEEMESGDAHTTEVETTKVNHKIDGQHAHKNCSERTTKKISVINARTKVKKVMRAKHSGEPNKDFHRPCANAEKPVDNSDPDYASRKTRDAARKAQEFLTRLRRSIVMHELNEQRGIDPAALNSFRRPNARQELEKFSEYYTETVIQPRIASKEQIRGWINELETNGRIVCTREGCRKILETRLGMIYHYEKACLSALQRWHCKLCKKRIKPSPEIMLKHFQKKHANKFEEHSVGSSKGKKSAVGEEVHYTGLLPVNNQFTNLFPEFKPKKTFWERVDSSAYLQQYVPFVETPIKVQLRNMITKCESTWFPLTSFESFPNNVGSSQATFFTGGPVWSSSWMPTPEDKQTAQYLVITTSSQAENSHHAFSTEQEKGLLQLWNFGDLRDTLITVQPSLEIAVPLNCGKIWQISCCPSGCWEEPSGYDSESDALPRLGLIAIACGDSYVRLFSIPHPDFLYIPSDQAAGLPFYATQPVAILKPTFSGGPSLITRPAVCTVLSWQRRDCCKLIACGYSTGMISVWHVTREPGLLTGRFEYQLVISPFRTFQAHSAAITCLDFAPLGDGRYLSTGSNDKLLKVWDLYEPGLPYMEYKKGQCKGLQWPSIWTGMFVCVDEGLISKAIASYQDVGICNRKINVSDHNSCAQGFSVSEHLNVVALGDSAGEVTASTLCRLNIEHWKSTGQQYPVFRTEVKPIADCDESDTSYGLVFLDCPLVDLAHVPDEEKQRLQTPDNMSSTAMSDWYPASINTVSWNPNKGSEHWLFTANQAGIARIVCGSGFKSQST